MLDHPAMSCPDYTTTLIAWYDGGMHFLSAVPRRSPDGFTILNVYFATYILIAVMGWLLTSRWRRQGLFRVTPGQTLEVAVMASIGMVVGGRLGEVLFYHPAYFFSQPLMIVESTSGFSVHGGLIGAVLMLWLWARWAKRPLLHVLDQGAMVFAFANFPGRIANFLTGGIRGTQAPDGLPWAMRFPLHDNIGRAYVAAHDGTTYVLVDDGARQTLEPAPIREGYEVLKDHAISLIDSATPRPAHDIVFEVVSSPRHPVTLYQALGDGLVVLALMLIVHRKAKNVGTATGAMLMLYGLMRGVTEFWRMPEAESGYLIGGLTTGQVMSWLMAVIGAGVLLYCRRRPLAIAGIPLPGEGTAR